MRFRKGMGAYAQALIVLVVFVLIMTFVPEVRHTVIELITAANGGSEVPVNGSSP